MQLIVLGMHRSGTSVLARLLNMMGVYFGPEGISTGANPENAKGFWERKDVRALNDWVLHSAGLDWNQVSRFDPDRLPEPVVSEFISHASRLILELDAHRPWLMKEPRLCLLFGLWRRVLEIPVCIHIHRSPVEVAASLQTRNGMSIEVGMAMWEAYVVHAHRAAAGLPAVRVTHRLLMEDPFTATEVLHGELEHLQVPGLRMPSQREIDAFIDRDLYRERDSRKDLEKFRRSAQNRLFEDLVAGQDVTERLEQGVSLDSLETLALYESNLPSPKQPVPIGKAEVPDVAIREKIAGQVQEIKMLREAATKLEARDRQREDRLSDNLVMLGKLQENASQRELELRAASASVGRLEAELKQRNSRLAEAELGASELRRSMGSLEAELNQRDARLADVQQELSEVRRELSRFKDKHEIQENKANSLQREMVGLNDSIEERFSEIAILTRQLLKRESELEDALSDRAATRKKLVSCKAELSGALSELTSARSEMRRDAAHLQAVRAELDGIRSSRAWRTLSSVASIGARLPGRRRGSKSALPDAPLVARSGLLDRAWYVATYPDVAESGVDPLEHYLLFGAAEGRDPSPHFSTRHYLSEYPDVAAACINPLVHFIRHGRSEGRSPLDSPEAPGR